MNKGQLIEAVAAELGASRAGASRAVDAFIACLTAGIRHDGSATLAGFGTFMRKERSARVVRNPITGQPMPIKASTTVTFRVSPALKESLSASLAATP
jgi:DNA-binding protein HU-beta